MRIIALGDTHGRDTWKKVVDKETFDKIVFIGDYFDSRDGTKPYEWINNFRDILEFKRENPDKVILLFGNHDYHYLRGVSEDYSGFEAYIKPDISEILDEAINNREMQMCFLHDDIIFTHAGVTQTWCKNTEINLNKIEESINDLFFYQPRFFGFWPGRNEDDYGDDITQSPIWVRPHSLRQDKVPGYKYVVGHTTEDRIRIPDDIVGDGVFLIDTLGFSGEYLIYEDGKFSVGKV